MKFKDPDRQEMVNYLREAALDADEFDIEAAIYWYASDHHGGQASNLYSASSTSQFRPGPTHNKVQDEGGDAADLYLLLVHEYSCVLDPRT
jgi:hypothetical protein